MGGAKRQMVTVEDVDSLAYRGIEVLLLLPIALFALLGVGVMFVGVSDSEAGVVAAVASLGVWYLGLLVVAFVSWLVTPFVLYLDAKKLKAADVDWDPDPALHAVLGLFFGYLMKLHHVYKRHKFVVDWVDRDWWWIPVAFGTVGPLVCLVAALTAGPLFGDVVTFLLAGLAILLAVPFPLAIYRDATYVRLNSPGWQPNPGNYLNVAVFLFVFAPIAFPLTGGYYLARRHLAVGTV